MYDSVLRLVPDRDDGDFFSFAGVQGFNLARVTAALRLRFAIIKSSDGAQKEK